MARAVAVMLALRAQHKTIQSAWRPDGMKLLAPSREQLVHVSLVADIENKMILRCIEHVVHGERQLDHTQVRSKMTARLRQHRDQLFPDLFGQRFQLRDA